MLRAAAVAVLSAWAALGVEFAVVTAIHGGMLTTAWETAVGSLWLVPTAGVAAVPFALAGGALFALLGLAGRPARIAFGCALGAYAGTVTFFVTTGRHFADPAARGGMVTALALVALAVGYAIAPLLSRLMRASPRGFALGALGLALVLSLVNRFALVRLYPAFHVGLAAAVLATAPLVVLPLLPARTRSGRIGAYGFAAVLVLAVLCGLSARPAASRLSLFDNYRLLLLEQAPMLGRAVELAAVLSPPPALDPLASEEHCTGGPPLCHGAPGGGAPTAAGPSFVGRDVVLVTIDALRADHVGAYGYGRATTPRLDALAEKGALFERAYCPTPHTSYSVTSMMTGKYMRPLLLQGAGTDSDTIATLLRTYGYKTAAFYPPAVFFIDPSRFEPFEKSGFGFEYRKVEFMEGEGRVRQVSAYLDRLQPAERVFLWVHLFGPHEPYESHPEHAFGERDVDRYDSEIARADATLGAVVDLVRKSRPEAVVVVSADHGEEFGEHGGRYHGTTVYEEQVRVPLVISAPGLIGPRRVREVVQTIDLLPTLLAAVSVPPSPRIRGRDLGPLLSGSRPETDGLAFAETEESALLAEGNHRLVCARKLGACRLYDLASDPQERADRGPQDGERLSAMRGRLSAMGASHGRFERDGARTESGQGWPAAILRAAAGDADAAPELAALLDDADRGIRRKAASLLFAARRAETIPSLRLALSRDEDAEVRSYCALALTRLGQAAPLASELFAGPDLAFRRLAALALAESGDARGTAVLIDWWQHGARSDYEQSLDVLAAFARLKPKDAVWPLVQSLGDVRLRPRIASTLAAIGEESARGPLVAALNRERYQTARVAITEALVALGGKEELARPLIRYLGVPDPLPGGVGYALRAKIIEFVGGPDDKTLRAVRTQSNVGVTLRLVVPKSGNGRGVRAVIRASATGQTGEVRLGRSRYPIEYDIKGKPINHRKVPEIHDRDYAKLTIPSTGAPVEVAVALPESLGAAPGRAVELVLFAERHVKVEGLVLVPLSDELPPPPPKAWAPTEPDGGAE